MKKGIISLILAAILVITAVFAVSCGSKYTNEEIREALGELIPASAELNEIYFGEGLPLSVNEDEYEGYYAMLESDVSTLGYEPVSEDAKYRTEAELREATLAVFTEEYARFLFERAFSGVSAVYDDETTANAVYARYIETDGVLTKRVGAKNEAIPLGREYRVDDAEIVREHENWLFVDVPSMIGGKDDVVVRLRLVKTAGGWRLDSPPY